MIGGDNLSKIVFISGGARSGKSSFGEDLLSKINGEKSYIATSIPFDEGMRDRIKKHVDSRPSDWKTYEINHDIDSSISDVMLASDGVILDCVTVLITNMMFKDLSIDWEKIDRNYIDEFQESILTMFKNMISEIRKYPATFIIISNELGMGIVPENRLSRIFRDIAGKVNQLLAKESDEAYVCISGIPLKLK